jgi:hypothetical protein
MTRRRQLESAEAKWHLQHQQASPATVIENISLGWLNILLQVCLSGDCDILSMIDHNINTRQRTAQSSRWLHRVHGLARSVPDQANSIQGMATA